MCVEIETKNIYPKHYTLNKDYQNPLLDSTKIEKSKKIKSKNEDMFFDNINMWKIFIVKGLQQPSHWRTVTAWKS